jgi:hypothetical protein
MPNAGYELAKNFISKQYVDEIIKEVEAGTELIAGTGTRNAEKNIATCVVICIHRNLTPLLSRI